MNLTKYCTETHRGQGLHYFPENNLLTQSLPSVADAEDPPKYICDASLLSVRMLPKQKGASSGSAR